MHGSPNEIVSGTPPVQLPKTNEEVKWRQMDIIYYLATHGVPVARKDSTGHTPFDKAILLDEINFMEGAVLLGELCCSYDTDTAAYRIPVYTDVLYHIQQWSQAGGSQVGGGGIDTHTMNSVLHRLTLFTRVL